MSSPEYRYSAVYNKIKPQLSQKDQKEIAILCLSFSKFYKKIKRLVENVTHILK